MFIPREGDGGKAKRMEKLKKKRSLIGTTDLYKLETVELNMLRVH